MGCCALCSMSPTATEPTLTRNGYPSSSTPGSTAELLYSIDGRQSRTELPEEPKRLISSVIEAATSPSKPREKIMPEKLSTKEVEVTNTNTETQATTIDLRASSRHYTFETKDHTIESFQVDDAVLSNVSEQLYIAAKKGDTAGVETALKAARGEVMGLGFIAIAANKNGAKQRTALHVACARGHEGVVKLLLGKDVGHFMDGKQKDSEGRTAFFSACCNGRAGVVKLLLEWGGASGKIDARLGDATNTPLHKACENGHEEVIKLLLPFYKRHFLNQLNSAGMQPLMLACGHGHFKVVQLLFGLEGLEPNIRTLHCACKNGSLEIVKFLLDHGLEVNAVSPDSGETPLHIACCVENNAKIVHGLLEAGADVLARDVEGATALHYACRSGENSAGQHPSVIRVLFRWDVGKENLNVCDGKGRTPLHFGAYDSKVGFYLSVVRMLFLQRQETTEAKMAAEDDQIARRGRRWVWDRRRRLLQIQRQAIEALL